MKKRLIASLAIVLGAMIGGGLYFIKESSIMYQIDYYEETDTHDRIYEEEIKHEIKIYKNLIKVKTIETARHEDKTSSKIKKEKYQYSDINMKKLENILNNEFNIKKKGYAVLYKDDLNYKQNAIMEALLISQYNFEVSAEDCKYFMVLNKDGGAHIFYLKENGQIEVKTLTYDKKDYSIITDLKSHSINFSEKNMNLIREYIINQVEEYEYTLNSIGYKDGEKILNSIIFNDESYLKDIVQIPQLEYIISYNGPEERCTYYSIELYSDGSFAYVINSMDTKSISFVGEYSGIDKVFVNPNSSESYVKIKDNKTNNYLSYNKEELYNLFKSLNNNSVNADFTNMSCYREIKE